MSDEINDQVEVAEQAPKAKATRAPKKIVEAVEGEVLPVNRSITMTASEYAEYSKANGRVMGRPIGTKTVLTPEEFVVLSRANWTPKMMMDKHGISLEELQNVAARVPLIMQLKRPIVVTEKMIKW